MKRLYSALFLALALLVASCAPEHPFLSKVPEIHDLVTGSVLSSRKVAEAPGIYGEWQTELFGSPQSVSFIRVSPEAYSFDILCAEGERADSTSALCSRFGALAGINGSYFNMRELTPVTYVKDDGFTVGTTSMKEASRTNGVFLSRTEGVCIEASDTTGLEDGAWEAMASGPILVDEGMAITYEEGIEGWKSFYARRHPRSLVGTDAQGYVWLVVVDGRSEGNAEGMSIAELTDFALSLGLTDALNLDGGGSSALWVLPEGIISHPCDNRAYDKKGQRIIPNALVVKEL